jgi:hypothetical protein
MATAGEQFPLDDAQDDGPELCRYSAAHQMAGTLADTTIDCRPIGIIPACQPCADFYDRMRAR